MPFTKGHPTYVSKESYKKLSERMMGKNNSFFGKKHSEKTKLKMKLSKKIKPVWSKGMTMKGTPYYNKLYSKEIIAKSSAIRTKVDCDARHNKIARKVMEDKLGRKLFDVEVIHHIDFDVRNNNIDNLHLFNTNSEHINYHHGLRKIVCSMFSDDVSTLLRKRFRQKKNGGNAKHIGDIKCPKCCSNLFVIKNGFTPKRIQKYICQNIKNHDFHGFIDRTGTKQNTKYAIVKE